MKTLQKCGFAVFLASVLVGISINIYGQNALITKRDSSKIETRIKAHSATTIMTNDGNIAMREVATVAFEKADMRDEKLYKQLEAAGVSMRFDHHASTTKSPIVQDPVYPASVTVSTDAMERFRTTRGTAKAFELIGALAISATLIMNAVASDQAQSDIKSGAYQKAGYKTPTGAPTAMPIAGGLMLSVGFIIDMNAGIHLKKP